MKRILLCLILFLAVYGSIRAYYHFTHGFTIDNITSSLNFDQRWEPGREHERAQVDAILSQEFRYLGKGCQSYVFESQDGKYVIKFFKYHRYRLKEWVNYFRFIPMVETHCESRMAHKTAKREGVFHSWRVAFDHAQEETGLIYVHLNKTAHLQKNLVIFDKMGSKHILDIDRFEFLIQKKATMLTDYIEEQNGKVFAFLDTLVSMIKSEYERGVADNDPAIMQNTGVIAGKPVHLDVGQFDVSEKYKDPELYRDEIFQKFYKFRRWLTKKYPETAVFLDDRLRHEFGESFFEIAPNPRY